MPINIKNERVTEMANRLAEQTGENLTDAVGRAVEEKLERLDAERRQKEKSVRLRAWWAEYQMQARGSEEWRKWDWEADLYDERGLPK